MDPVQRNEEIKNLFDRFRIAMKELANKKGLNCQQPTNISGHIEVNGQCCNYISHLSNIQIRFCEPSELASMPPGIVVTAVETTEGSSYPMEWEQGSMFENERLSSEELASHCITQLIQNAC